MNSRHLTTTVALANLIVAPVICESELCARLKKTRWHFFLAIARSERVVTTLCLIGALCFSSSTYAKGGDPKRENAVKITKQGTSRSFGGVTATFELIDSVVESGKSLTVRLILKNKSDSPTEFRYLNTSFIEHIRIYDAENQRVPFRASAPFPESAAARITLRAGEMVRAIVSIDLWRYYDLRPGKYFLEFTYDLRLVSDPALSAQYMKRYQSDDLVLWDTKKHPFTVGDHDVTVAAIATKGSGFGTLTRKRHTDQLAPVSSATESRLGSRIDDFRSLWGPPSDEESLIRTATLKWNRLPANGESIVPGVFAAEVAFLDGTACEIALRSRQRITTRKVAELAKPFLTTFRSADFAKPKSDLNGFRIYELSEGNVVLVNKHERHNVIVIMDKCYLRNQDVFDGEAAKVRPPTSNH